MDAVVVVGDHAEVAERADGGLMRRRRTLLAMVLTDTEPPTPATPRRRRPPASGRSPAPRTGPSHCRSSPRRSRRPRSPPRRCSRSGCRPLRRRCRRPGREIGRGGLDPAGVDRLDEDAETPETALSLITAFTVLPISFNDTVPLIATKPPVIAADRVSTPALSVALSSTSSWLERDGRAIDARGDLVGDVVRRDGAAQGRQRPVQSSAFDSMSAVGSLRT